MDNFQHNNQATSAPSTETTAKPGLVSQLTPWLAGA